MMNLKARKPTYSTTINKLIKFLIHYLMSKNQTNFKNYDINSMY